MLKGIMDIDDALLDTDDSQEYPKFMKWVQSNNEHLVTIWHKIDHDRNMSLHRAEFSQGLRRLKYPGNVDRLWSILDHDTTGNISFLEFAPEELRHTIRTLFLFLDHDGIALGRGTITEDELKFLDVWKPPVYLWEVPEARARDLFVEALLARHSHNMLLVWRKVLDTDASMKVSFEEFMTQCKALHKKGKAEALPPCGMPALYTSFDQDRCGWFALRDWSPETFEQLTAFVKFCKTKHGSVKNFYKMAEALQVPVWETTTTEGITALKFAEALKDMTMPQDQFADLFEGLCIRRTEGPKGSRIYEGELTFLDRWDPEMELKEAALWPAIIVRSGTAGLMAFPR